jgi:hypothetical protein
MLAEVLLKVAGMEYEEREGHGQYYPRPSLAGPERCTRQMVYWAKGEQLKPLPGRAVVVMSDSSWHEDLTADLIRKSAFQLHSEQMPVTISGAFPWRPDGTWECPVCKKQDAANPLIDNRDCHGHMDFIVTDILGVDRLVEHKSLSHWGFEGIRGGNLPLDYFTQHAIYLRGAALLNPDLKEGVLLIKNKNQSAYLDLLVEYDPVTDSLTVKKMTHHTGEVVEINVTIANITLDAFIKFSEVEAHRKEQSLPDRPYAIDHWRCEYCGFNQLCWASWAEEHQSLATDQDLEGEIADLVRYEREVGANAGEMKKEQDGLREIIKGKLKAKGVRTGKAGEYMVDWSVETQQKLDKEALNPGVRQAATVTVPVEKLTIRKIKEEKNGEAKPKEPRKPREKKSNSIMERMG